MHISYHAGKGNNITMPKRLLSLPLIMFMLAACSLPFSGQQSTPTVAPSTKPTAVAAPVDTQVPTSVATDQPTDEPVATEPAAATTQPTTPPPAAGTLDDPAQ